MFFIDTHAHIYLNPLASNIEDVIQRARQTGLKKIIMPAIEKKHFSEMQNISERYKDIACHTIGLHPRSVKEKFCDELDFVKNELFCKNYFAIGEIGIDLYWGKTYIRQQCEAFEFQLKLAIHHNIPVIIHQRESFDQIFEILEKIEFNNLNGVFHCFDGNLEVAERCINLGFLLGIGGKITYKDSFLKNVVKYIPLDYFVLETDSPFLTPVHCRGKTNEPSYITYIAQTIANIKKCSIDKIAEKTSFNAERLFGV